MEKEDYAAFKQWLSDTGRTDRKYRETVDSLWSINKFLERGSWDYRCKYVDLHSIIKYGDYNELYRFRHCKRYDYGNGYNFTKDACIEASFAYLGKSYDDYIRYEAERTISERYNDHVLYLHMGNIACLRYEHPIEPVTASIACMDGHTLKMHASRCTKCGITFMRKSVYDNLRKHYKVLVANFCEVADDGYSIVQPGKFSAESPLMLCGYTVRRGALSDEERQSILLNVIMNGILSKREVLDYLAHFLIFNASGGRMFMAECKWRQDLRFVNQIGIDEQESIKIDEVRSYRRSEIIGRINKTYK